jgi:pre-mRNA-processing factor 8
MELNPPQDSEQQYAMTEQQMAEKKKKWKQRAQKFAQKKKFGA